MKSDQRRSVIPFAEVRGKLGPALFGTEWIEKLTAKERWRLEENPTLALSVDDGFLLPIKTVPGSQSYLGSQSSRDFDRSIRERIEFMEWQATKILRWLERQQIVVIVAADGRRSVLREDFERAFAKTFPAIGNSAEAFRAPAVDARTPAAGTTPRLVAKRGNRSYKDAPLVAEVRHMVKSGQHKTPHAAAWAIVDRIPGAGTPESKARRIATKARR